MSHDAYECCPPQHTLSHSCPVSHFLCILWNSKQSLKPLHKSGAEVGALNKSFWLLKSLKNHLEWNLVNGVYGQTLVSRCMVSQVWLAMRLTSLGMYPIIWSKVLVCGKHIGQTLRVAPHWSEESSCRRKLWWFSRAPQRLLSGRSGRSRTILNFNLSQRTDGMFTSLCLIIILLDHSQLSSLRVWFVLRE